MLDSALHACVGLTAAAAQLAIELPFSMDRVESFAPCSAEMWARVRLASDVAGVKKFDIDLCDTHGDIGVRILGFATRRLKTATENQTGFENLSGLSAVETRLLLPREKPTVPVLSERPPAKGETVVVLGGSASAKAEVLQRYPHAVMLERTVEETPASLAQRFSGVADIRHILWLNTAPPFAIQQVSAQQENGVLWLFKCIKALLALGYAEKTLNWTLLTSGVNDATIHGLVGSMAKEYPNWRVRLVESDAAIELSTLFSLPFDTAGDVLIYRKGQWYQEVLLPVQEFAPATSLYQKHGVYVVIGGAGGLGAAWSQYMIHRYQAQIIWLGRRDQDADITAKIEQAGAPPPVYIAADISDLAALQAAYARIKAQYPRINGVVHSALVLADKSLMNMTEATFRAALAPKVAGTVNLAQVFAQEPLDFMLFFSAMQSFTKAAGQSNYAAGCAFADAFAKHFAGTANYPVKIMNWGYWGSVGIVASEPYREHLAKQGLASIEVEEGMAVLEKLLVAPVNALGFIKTNTAFAWSRLDNSVFVDIYR
jgi:NADP-dependent 3-hydroxy acid dehydrogenase YdfG